MWASTAARSGAESLRNWSNVSAGIQVIRPSSADVWQGDVFGQLDYFLFQTLEDLGLGDVDRFKRHAKGRGGFRGRSMIDPDAAKGVPGPGAEQGTDAVQSGPENLCIPFGGPSSLGGFLCRFSDKSVRLANTYRELAARCSFNFSAAPAAWETIVPGCRLREAGANW